MIKLTLTCADDAERVLYETLATDPPASRMVIDARVAELADAALLKSVPEEGLGSSPGAGTFDAGEAGREHVV